MNLSDIKTLYDFNFWANNRLFTVLEGLTEEQYSKDLQSSHGGIKGTLGHILASHEMWLSRWQGNPSKTTIDANGGPSLTTAKQFWDEMQQKLSTFVNGLTEADLLKPISYTNVKGETYSTPLWQMMLQVVTHGVYHRGQIVTMLRQLGVKPINTDIIFYFRQPKK
jgi:uncharacterized damage-inducible protein DinB